MERRSPAPSTSVVLSLSTMTRLAVPRSSMVTFSSLTPMSSVMRRPARERGDVLEDGLARSPKAGALTAQTLIVPRSG
jgi:hypothetical protein